jgi:Alginate lyase
LIEMFHSKFALICAVAVGFVARIGFAMDLQYAAEVRQKIAENQADFQPALNLLVTDADKALSAGPFAVTDKKVFATSGDPHDYVSLAPYFWPDPAKPDGLPYKSRDGEVWPGARDEQYSDRLRMEKMFTAVRTLNLAAYFTGKPQYARRSAQLLKIFFLDPKTAMNPNLNFAQAVRGESSGRSYGIIDLNSVPDFLDSMKLMEQVAPQDVWTAQDRAGFRTWCRQFLDWLQTSKNGQEESRATNNHGAWFDATASCFADFLGDSQTVAVLVKSSESRIASQIRADGSLPLEMARTRSRNYTTFALQAFTVTSERARRAGLDLWHFRPADPTAGDLNTAVSHLLHYTETGEPWPKKDIDKPEEPIVFYLTVRSQLDPARDSELCRRLDAVLSSHADHLRTQTALLTIGPLPSAK